MAVEDCMRIDSAEFVLGLKDINAAADTLELLSMLLVGNDLINEEGVSKRMASALHVLAVYLENRCQHMGELGYIEFPHATSKVVSNFWGECIPGAVQYRQRG